MALGSMAVNLVRLSSIDVLLWLHTVDDPPDDEWDEWLNPVVDKLRSLDRDHRHWRGLVISDGGAPNTRQRRFVVESVWGGKSVKSAVFTPTLDNPIKRGIATAIMWVQPQLRFLRPAQWYEGLAHIDATTEAPKLLAGLTELQTRVGPVATLEAIKALKPVG